MFFLISALPIAAPLFLPSAAANKAPAAASADAYDRRIVTLLAFGPMATVLALSAVSGRGTVAMWGYPLWLFLGLWIVTAAQHALAGAAGRLLLTWAIVFSCLGTAFIANYAVLPNFDHRYRAVFFPGVDLGREISQRYRAVTGKPVAYVIGTMWDGGNVAHYAPSHPRVLIDGKPARAPWIDLNDLKARGAVVAWTAGDPTSFRRNSERSPPTPRCSRRSLTSSRWQQDQCRLGDSAAEAVLTPPGLAGARYPKPVLLVGDDLPSSNST